MELILQAIAESGGQSTLSLITLACVLYTNKRLNKHIVNSNARNERLNTIGDAQRIEMLQHLRTIHHRCEKTHNVSDEDWKEWNEIFGIYTGLNGNGVAMGWNKDMEKWRK